MFLHFLDKIQGCIIEMWELLCGCNVTWLSVVLVNNTNFSACCYLLVTMMEVGKNDLCLLLNHVAVL